MSVIIVGASGFLGRNLRQSLIESGEQVIGTYSSIPVAGLRHFDLREPALAALGREALDARAAVVCSSVTDMDRCRRDWAGTHRVNVEGTVSLLAQLQDSGILPVFISTDYVYDGAKGMYSEDDERSPVLAYGEQKKEVEEFLLQSRRPFIIARMGRVYSLLESEDTILMRVVNALRRDETIRMAVDQIFSPSHISDICGAIGALVDGPLNGSINLGPPSGISRYDFAAVIKAHLRISSGRIVAGKLAEMEFGDKRPLDTSLNTSRMTAALGRRFASIDEVFGAVDAPARPLPAQ